jgi:hypothetical protein
MTSVDGLKEAAIYRLVGTLHLSSPARRKEGPEGERVRLAGGWLVLIYSERKVLLPGCWFVLGEKYCWLVADKPSEQTARVVCLL